MKQGLSLRVSQHLALTPQLQQSIRLLQLSTLELSQEIDQMLDDNPFLEKEMEDLAPREDFGLEQENAAAETSEAEPDNWDGPMDRVSEIRVETASEVAAPIDAEGVAESWDGDGSVEFSPDDSEWGGDAPARNNNNDDEKAQATELARNQESLTAFLHRQALSLRLDDTDRAALRFLIESLNDDGYLEDSFQSLAESLAGDDLEQCEELVHRFQVALGLLQSLEPTGVGARDLGECLRLQLQAVPADTEERAELRACALAICKQPLEMLAKRDVKRLAVVVSESESLVKLAIALIARLEPKPGRRFIDVERNVVVPDVLVLAHGVDKQGLPQFRAMLNPEVMPRLKVNDIYASALKGGKGDSHAGLQQRLQEARWMIKNIQQRFDTILRVSNAITQRQKSFFIHGELAMKPMVLREIAEELGLHESTISRVTTAKYMHTPYGTFELKYFFGSGLGTDSGNNASSTAVRALIKQLIASENPKKPLSDNQLSDMLKEQGIDCARRTVAKYREALRIAPTNLRKAL
ncbi:MAG: RNA polymerase factor sigma-54 [Limnohabitans sp.]|jgi:RNA polymerase sigma-54 factor|nr:RNA polymerase factor sigma-54 [Limnohabitans sp.]